MDGEKIKETGRTEVKPPIESPTIKTELNPEEQEVMKKLKDIIAYLAKLLHLDGWRINVKLVPTLSIQELSNNDVSYPYRAILIQVESQGNLKRYNLPRIVSHELIQAIVGVIRDKVTFLLERRCLSETKKNLKIQKRQ